MRDAHERRRFDRVAVEELVVVVMPRGNAVGEVRDLSPRGMFVALTTPPTPGESVVVHVNPAHARAAVEVVATVRWTCASGAGLELAELGARDLAVFECILGAR